MVTESLSNDDNEKHSEKLKLILEEARIQFDRFHSDIDSINSKIVALFQIFLVIITIQITVFIYYFSYSDIKAISIILFACLVPIYVIGLTYFFVLVIPKKYEYPFLFERKRFNELIESTEYEILADFYYHTDFAYNANQTAYKDLILKFKRTLLLLAANLIIFGLFILSII